MLRIRLSRKGKKKQPQYRVVVADVKFKRDGRFLENIGFYNPLTDPPTIQIEEGRALHWLSVGAQPSDPVKHMLEKQGTYERLQRLHKGEALEDLVAEFTGQPAASEAPAEGKADEPAALAVEDEPAAEADDSAEDTASGEDASSEDTSEEDASEEDASEEDASEEDASEEDASGEDASEEDASEEAAAEDKS